MRLIDVDSLIAKHCEGCIEYRIGCKTDPVCASFMWFEVTDAPIVDAVPVVRCKECKHYKKYDDEIEGVTWQGLCKNGEFFTDDLDFCSRGERKCGEC